MKKFKGFRILVVAMMLVLSIGLLAGCGTKDDEKDATPAGNNTEANAEDTAKMCIRDRECGRGEVQFSG